MFVFVLGEGWLFFLITWNLTEGHIFLEICFALKVPIVSEHQDIMKLVSFFIPEPRGELTVCYIVSIPVFLHQSQDLGYSHRLSNWFYVIYSIITWYQMFSDTISVLELIKANLKWYSRCNICQARFHPLFKSYCTEFSAYPYV